MAFILTPDDNINIQLAKTESDPWKSEYVTDLKRRIKEYYRNQNNSCCYCKRNFVGEYNLVIDIEHILPKSLYGQFMFEIKNLSIACKRCNMDIKKARTEFIDSSLFNINSPFISNYYLIIHPNIDNYYSHMSRTAFEINDFKFIKYSPKDQKGSYTYNFFQLMDLEIEQLDKIQDCENEEISNLPSEIREFISNSFR